MRRRLFNLAAVVSLLIWVAMAALWVASYFSKFDVNWFGGTVSWELLLSRGEMSIERVQWRGVTNAANVGWTFRTAQPGSLIDAPAIPGYFWQTHFRAFGFAAVSFHFRVVAGALRIVWPCWVVMILTAFLPLLGILRKRRESPSVPLCSRCGYNLTANTSGTCPECGAAILTNTGNGR